MTFSITVYDANGKLISPEAQATLNLCTPVMEQIIAAVQARLENNTAA